jgi:2-keto-myo-inositol isomerase
MMNRRDYLKVSTGVALGTLLTGTSCGSGRSEKESSTFKFCLNTSTIRGQAPGLIRSIEIASEAGYDGIELWVRDVKEYVDAGNSLEELSRIIKDHGLIVENAIGFAPWIVDDEQERLAGMQQMREEMEMMAKIGCKRIAAPPAGYHDKPGLDYMEAGKRYRELLLLGEETGVTPHLEFWGASKSLFHLGQALLIAAAADHPGVRILPDVYHLFRGGSGFNGLKMLRGEMIEVFHVNDYPGHIPREEQVDADRVYPGDGVAPIKQVFADLRAMGGEKVLSLELFNKEYWDRDPLEVAREGLAKMKKLTE